MCMKSPTRRERGAKMKTSGNRLYGWLVAQKCSACILLNCVPGTGLQNGHLFLIHWKCLLGRNDSITKSSQKKNKLTFMPIHLLYMTKGVTRSILLLLSLEQPMPVSSGRQRPDWNFSITWFSPKANNLNSPYFEMLVTMYCYCLHTSVSCENIPFFWTQKSGFCPFSPETRWWPTDSHWQKGQRFPLLPPCPDVIRPYTGDPQQQRKLSESVRRCEHSFMTATTQALSGQLQMGGCWMPLVIPMTAGSEAAVRVRAEPSTERQSPSHNAECAQSLRMPLKSLLLSLWGAAGRQYSRRFFLQPANQ